MRPPVTLYTTDAVFNKNEQCRNTNVTSSVNTHQHNADRILLTKVSLLKTSNGLNNCQTSDEPVAWSWGVTKEKDEKVGKNLPTLINPNCIFWQCRREEVLWHIESCNMTQSCASAAFLQCHDRCWVMLQGSKIFSKTIPSIAKAAFWQRYMQCSSVLFENIDLTPAEQFTQQPKTIEIAHMGRSHNAMKGIAAWCENTCVRDVVITPRDGEW